MCRNKQNYHKINTLIGLPLTFQASCKAFQVILVGTFLDKMDVTPEAKAQEIERLEGLLRLKIPYAREALQLCPVSCISTEGMSCVLRKPVFGVSDQVLYKPGCMTTED